MFAFDQPAALDPDKYERHKAKMAARSRAMSQAGREIGDLPPIEQPKRRASCAKSLRRFCEHYLGDQFRLRWAPFHRDVIAKLEAAIQRGGSTAYALPRGSGKTTLAKAASIWAVVYGYRRYPLIVAATAKDAAKILRSIKKTIETSPNLAADFPELCYPIQALRGINQKAAGQLYKNEPTGLQWRADAITFARIPGSLSSESTIETIGITGAIRGRNHTLSTGEIIRPDLVLIDDPQTRKSARSAAQTQARLDTIQSDILGSAGPDTSLAAVCCCTVIYPNDLSDQLLDRAKFPQWQGVKAGLVNRLPDNADLVDQYAAILRAELVTGRENHEGATRFYRRHRRALELDIVATWPDRFIHGREVSAIQYALNLYLADPIGFWAEYQNDPHAAAPTTTTAPRETILEAVNTLPRAEPPEAAAIVTAFIDCHLRALYWAVAAWLPDLTGFVLDYGTWPDQRRGYFTLANCPRTIGQAYPNRPEPAQLTAAIDDLAGQLLTRTYTTAQGLELSIDTCLVDTGWNYDAVQEAARRTPHRPRLLPSKGVPVGPARRPISEWSRQPGDKIGAGWIHSRPARRQARILQFDANYWKANLHRALNRAPGDPGSVSLFRPAAGHGHELLADHLTAETAIETFGQGRTVYVFSAKPDRPDNHWLDCLTGAMVAASFRGGAVAAKPTTPRKKVGYLEL